MFCVQCNGSEILSRYKILDTSDKHEFVWLSTSLFIYLIHAMLKKYACAGVVVIVVLCYCSLTWLGFSLKSSGWLWSSKQKIIWYTSDLNLSAFSDEVVLQNVVFNVFLKNLMNL